MFLCVHSKFMKAVILAGGYGTRISEESVHRPKPMIEIGGMPILWHIMKEYSHYGINDFIICGGYKQQSIKEWFSNYELYNCDVTFDYKNGCRITNRNDIEDWKVTIADTGLNTMTGGRIKKIKKYVDGESFCLTYGDGVSDIPINDVINFHFKQNKIATISAVQPEGRFGALDISGVTITSFREKEKNDVGWINAGYMVLNQEVFDYIREGDEVVFEQEPLHNLAKDGQLCAYKYNGFWQCMDTMKDKDKLQSLWDTNNAPWKVW